MPWPTALFAFALLLALGSGCTPSPAVATGRAVTTSRAEASAAVAAAQREAQQVGIAAAGTPAQRDLDRAQAALDAGDVDRAAHFAYLARRGFRIAVLERQLDAAERDVADADVEGGRRLRLTDAFRTGQTDLLPASRAAVDRVAEYLRAHPARVALVEGYTDSTGEADRNLDLSVRRAEAVKDRLVEAGIDPARVATAGYGPRYPVASNDTDEGRRRNRRIEIAIDDRIANLPVR